MGAAAQPRDRGRTDAFRYEPRAARWAVGLLALLLALTVVAFLSGPGFGKSSTHWLWAALAIGCLALLLAGFLWAMRRRPVVLRVGPAGIDLPASFARPLAWADIHRIRRLPESRGLTGRRHWIVIDPAPGVLPDYRAPGPHRLEMWLMPRWGVRVPLHELDAQPDAVIASIERYRPVSAPG